jgi:hypothetical protein
VVDLLHHFDFKVTLDQQLPEPHVLRFDGLETAQLINPESAVALAPPVDALLADTMMLGIRHWVTISFPEDPNDLLLAVTRFLHFASFLRWKTILSNYAWCKFPEAGLRQSIKIKNAAENFQRRF